MDFWQFSYVERIESRISGKRVDKKEPARVDLHIWGETKRVFCVSSLPHRSGDQRKLNLRGAWEKKRDADTKLSGLLHMVVV